MKKRYVTILLTLIPLSLSAQQVSNIRAQQEGREIAVYYDLSATANVSLKVKVNGKTIKPQLTSGDIGRHVESGTQRRIAWQVLDENNGRFKAQNVVFSVRANAPWRTFLLAEGAISPKPFQYSAGLMAGVVSRAGVYVKARSSFQFGTADGYIRQTDGTYYVSTSDANLTNAEMPYLLSGKERLKHYVADLGVITRFLYKNDYMCYVYVGAGYGERQLLLQTNDDKWLNYEPTSYKGVSLDAGLMMAYKHFTISLGANMILPTYTEIQFGIGYIFN